MDANIINCSLNKITKEQREAGVISLNPKYYGKLSRLLKSHQFFNRVPTSEDIEVTAEEICTLLDEYAQEEEVDFNYVLIDGPGYLMSTLEEKLRSYGWTPLYSFKNPDRFSETFNKHIGFIEK